MCLVSAPCVSCVRGRVCIDGRRYQAGLRCMQLLMRQRAACWLSWWRMARRLNALTMQVNEWLDDTRFLALTTHVWSL